MNGARKVGTRHAALAVAATLAVGLVAAAAAFACTGQSLLKVNLATGAPGSVVTLTGEQWELTDPPATVVLRWAGTEGRVLASATLEPSAAKDRDGNILGQFQADVTIPADAYNGTYLIVASVTGKEPSKTSFQVVGGENPPKATPTATAPAQSPVVEEPAAAPAEVTTSQPATSETTTAAQPARRPVAAPAPSSTSASNSAPAVETLVAETPAADVAPAADPAPVASSGGGLPPVSSDRPLPLVISDPSVLGAPRTAGSGPSTAVVLMLAILGVGVFATGTTLVVRDVRARRVKAGR